MNFADIKIMDVGDGPGIRVSLFVSGCNNKCPGCFNQEAWDFNYGRLYTADVEAIILNKLRFDYVAGLSILGGEPMDIKNSSTVYDLVTRVKRLYDDSKSVWIYSGYTYEQIWRNYGGIRGIELLKIADVLVDGPYIDKLHDVTLRFRGSSNQRIIDLKKSTIDNIVLWEG